MSYAGHKFKRDNNTGGNEGRVSLFGAFPPPSRGARIYDPDVRLKSVRAKKARNRRPPKGWTEKFLAAMGLNSPHSMKSGMTRGQIPFR